MSLVLAGLGVSGVIWGNAIAMTMTGALYCLPAILLIRRTWGVLSWMSAWRVLKVDRREIARFLAYDNLNALVGMIPKQLDLVLLGYFRNPAEVGYYKLAQSLAGTVGYLVSPLQSVTYPELSRLWIAGAWTAMRVKLRYLVLWIGVPAGLGVVTGSLLLFWVIPALTGEAYRPAIGAAQILLGGSAIWLGFFWLRPVYFAQGNIRQWLLISTKVALLSLVVYPLIIKQWGYLGLAVWSAMMQLLAHCLAGFYIWRELIK
jgi:O-antigen/teichoic acid export membrane protein